MHTYKVLICGGVSTGKSSLIKRFIEKTFPNPIQSSKSLEFYIKDLFIDEEKITLQFWDMGSEDYPKELLQSYAEGTSGVIITYDSTNSKTLEKTNWWLNILSEMLPVNIPYLLVGCKSDLTHIEDFTSFTSSSNISSSILNADISRSDTSPNSSIDIESFHTATDINSLTPSTGSKSTSLDANNNVILPQETSETLLHIDTQLKMITIDESTFTKKEDIKTLIANHSAVKIDHIETSSFTGINVDEAVEKLAKCIKRAQYYFSY